jgi:hypothetical protein
LLIPPFAASTSLLSKSHNLDIANLLNSLSYPGLFTSRDCRNGKEAAYEAVVNYREWAAMKPVW